MMNRAAAARPIPNAVATHGLNVRREFIQKTYLHLLLAVAVFALGAYLMVTSGWAHNFTVWMAGGGFVNMLLFLGGFMAIGYLSHRWAVSESSKQIQYLGLFVGALGYAFFFTPLLYVAAYHTGIDGPATIAKAGIITGFIFTGLTATVIFTKKDFSFLRGAISIGTFAALGLILLGWLGMIDLGAWFSVAMIVLMAGYILWRTSQVFQHYPPTAHVAAALGLFADLAMMFFYVLRLLMELQSD